MAAFEVDQQPEYAGPTTALDFGNGGPFPEARGPQRAGPGEVTIGHAERMYLPSPEDRENRRAAEALGFDAGELALRNLVHASARQAGADYRTAQRTADELIKRSPAAVPETISEQSMDQLLDAVERAVSNALAGTVEKPRRPHRRVNPPPDAEPAATKTDTPEETS